MVLFIAILLIVWYTLLSRMDSFNVQSEERRQRKLDCYTSLRLLIKGTVGRKVEKVALGNGKWPLVLGK